MNIEHTAPLAVPDDLTLDQQLEMEELEMEMKVLDSARYGTKYEEIADLRQVKDDFHMIEGKKLELRRRKKLLEMKKENEAAARAAGIAAEAEAAE
jgi:hypothetical protein